MIWVKLLVRSLWFLRGKLLLLLLVRVVLLLLLVRVKPAHRHAELRTHLWVEPKASDAAKHGVEPLLHPAAKATTKLRLEALPAKALPTTKLRLKTSTKATLERAEPTAVASAKVAKALIEPLAKALTTKAAVALALGLKAARITEAPAAVAPLGLLHVLAAAK